MTLYCESSSGTEELPCRREATGREWVNMGQDIVDEYDIAVENSERAYQEQMHERLVDAFGPDGNFR